ncbi:MAG TPA: DUF4405 domain-containing protein [Oscillospiraceae bacterium]|nr:DUF4405 domain-containing protein [Oscillospiraceae bacterium]HPS35331.1 DUF4405 domain-containing protein [Oscillospiraceae bacterium]
MKKTAVKLSIDVFMTGMWLALMTYDLTGSVWHEILGIGMAVPLFFHLFLNRKWITGVTGKLFKTKFNVNTVRWICDVLMLIGYVLTAVSGIAISKELFWPLRAENNALWYAVHAWAAYVTLAVMGIHIGLHWKMILGFFRSMFGSQKITRARRTVGAVISLAVIVYGIKSTVTYSLPTYTAADDATTDYTVSQLSYAEYGSEGTGLKIINIDTKISSNNTITETPQAGDTFNDYLGRLFCNGCHRHCSLLAPACSIGRSLVTEAKTIYTEFTASASSENTPSSSAASSEAASSQSSASSETSSAQTPGSQTASSKQSASSEQTGSAQTPSSAQSASSATQMPSNDNIEYVELGNGKKIAQNLSILGMYIAGTYYIVEFLGKRNG